MRICGHCRSRQLVWAGALVILAAQSAFGQELQAWKMTVGRVTRVGLPIRGAEGGLSVLTPDGVLHPLSGRVQLQKAGAFRPIRQAEMLQPLRREFGPSFQVSRSAHYIVVHPTGSGGRWVERFESIYSAFQLFFRVRGLAPRPPRFPLVAVVFPDQPAMFRYAAREGAVPISPNLRGYYAQGSNRIVMYDIASGGRGSDELLGMRHSTLIHEAAHQIAFNSGLHSRYATPPRWLAEGFGCLFEAPGVWDATSHPQLSQRLNHGRLRTFARRRPSLPDGFLLNMLTDDDRLFRRDPDLAYAESWAFTFYLSEREPERLWRYMLLTAARKPERRPTRESKLREFATVFGANWRQVESRFSQYMSGLTPR